MSSTLYGLPFSSSGFDSEYLQIRLLESKHPEVSLVFNKNIIFTKGEDSYISCRLEGMPSQCGIILYCGWDWINFNLLKQQLENCNAIARRLSYTKAMITHTATDFISELVDNHGWKIVEEFVNERSGNKVFVVTYDL